MPKEISKSDLRANAAYLVRGKVAYSHISRQTTDAERARANAKRKYPIDKNYTFITLHGATVLCKDPQAPTVEERYAAECLYQDTNPKHPGLNFSAINKSCFLPSVFVKVPGTENSYAPVKLEGELDSGLDVTLVMRVFSARGTNGVTLDRVLVNEPLRYYDEGKFTAPDIPVT